MTNPAGSDVAAGARAGPDTAGAKLKAAREAAGLSVDAVAQQLKLAPRQVRALEDDAWERLPGRTFVRGFARNYARFVRLDPDTVLALLPAGDTAPALERPALAASHRPMGEIPVERVARPSPARWLIPLLVLAGIAVVAYYEAWRIPLRWPFFGGTSTTHPATTSEGVAPAGSREPRGTQTTMLPNPVTDSTTAATSEAKEGRAAAPVESVLPPPAAATPAPAATPLPGATRAPAAADAETASTPPAEASLVLTFKGTSWAEVKDARGRVILQMTGGAGMTQTVSGVPPLELALGNAPEVAVSFRGQALDLAPYLRGNVARVALK